VLAIPLTAALAQESTAPAPVPKPPALVADGIPPVPAALALATRPYMEFRTAGFAGWNSRDRSMLISTRFGNTNQLHRVAMPMGDRQQLSFEAEPVGGSWSPAGDVLRVSKDVGGNEFFQLHTLAGGQLRLITDGTSRNQFNAWSHDGRWLGYSSTRRNGTDTDLYVVDPRDPSTNRMVAQVSGGGWAIADFSPDNRRAAVIEYRQMRARFLAGAVAVDRRGVVAVHPEGQATQEDDERKPRPQVSAGRLEGESPEIVDGRHSL